MSKWEEWKKAMGETRPWHMLDPQQYVEDPATADARMDICKACPFLTGITHQCKKCGCLMVAKTKLEYARCPIGKW
jgi:hypothetical protein